jgi:PAS domain-containing protein
MGLADAAIRGIVTSVAFRASAAPYLLVDTDLRILGANLAYQRATRHDSADLTGELLFDVFPDNPATPEEHASARLEESLQRALSTGRRDRMDLQRYDVRNPRRGEFVEKRWLPNNTPVRDAEDRAVGVLHHVEDVTHLTALTELERDLGAPAAGRVEAVLRDSVARQLRARALLERSEAALGRVQRRIEAG